MPFTHRICDLPSAFAGTATVCGRVVQTAARSLDLDDGTAARRFPLPPSLPAPPLPGDLVALSLLDGAPCSLQVLSSYQGPGPFPPPGGDWYRLRKDEGRRLNNLQRRGLLLSAIRRHFAAREFLEIEAPLVVPSPGLELHLSAFPVGGARDRYLITSPEYQLKRLLVAGLPRVYSLGKVFRQGETGPQHNPEFTMLEWYRAFEGWEAVARDVEELCAELATVIGGGQTLQVRGATLDLSPPWPRMTVAEALSRYAGVRIRGDEDGAELRARISEAGHRPGTAQRFDDLFFTVFLDHVEPKLSQAGRPMILYDWPRALCALARSKPGAPEVVERFEAYAAGLELCNGFGELCDPAEQRRRFTADLNERARRGLPQYPVDERFLDALSEGLPPSGGVALGVDRLLMLLLGAETISEVLPFSAAEL